MSSPRIVFLHRPDVLDEGELDAAEKHFTLATSRLDVRPGDVVIARHFAWPHPRELFGDLKRLGAKAVNGLRGHAYAADLLSWSADLGDLAPLSTDHFERLPEVGPYILKGEKADKGRWDRMFAATATDAMRVRSALMVDSGMRGQAIVARQYVDLRSLGASPIPGACPPSVEYRVWMWRHTLLSAALYWPMDDCDPALLAMAPAPSEIPSDFIQSAASRVADRVDFYTLDVGIDTKGRWWVIEVSDGLRAGMCHNDPATVYGALAAEMAARLGP